MKFHLTLDLPEDLKNLLRQAVGIFRHIAQQREQLMMDLTRLTAAIERLEADDRNALDVIAHLRDQNKQIVGELGTVKQQIADLGGGIDTTSVQASIDGIAQRLETTANLVETAVAENDQVTNLPPTPAAA